MRLASKTPNISVTGTSEGANETIPGSQREPSFVCCRPHRFLIGCHRVALFHRPLCLKFFEVEISAIREALPRLVSLVTLDL